MSKNFAVLPKPPSDLAIPSRGTQLVSEAGTYGELIRRLFAGPSAVAIIGSDSGLGAGNVCDGIAAELGASGKRVVIVAVDKLLRMNPTPVPDEAVFRSENKPNAAANVWIWPEPAGQRIEFFKSRESAGGGPWLASLRRHFDSVLLDCPALEAAGATEVAAMADAAVLVVESGRTAKQKILLDQRALQSGGVKLAGCVVIARR